MDAWRKLGEFVFTQIVKNTQPAAGPDNEYILYKLWYILSIVGINYELNLKLYLMKYLGKLLCTQAVSDPLHDPRANFIPL